jgi:pyridoxal phosphate enzyme (YggS family)
MSIPMDLSHQYKALQTLINNTAQSSHRDPNTVLLLAVSKQQSIERIKEAFQLGIHDFGENYVQEAYPKIVALRQLPIHWHFIGRVQTNKTKLIATYFTWVHCISHLKTAIALNKHRPETLPALQVCLQIKLVADDNKAGIKPTEAKALATAIQDLPHLKLRGLMLIPPEGQDNWTLYYLYRQLNELREQLNCDLNLQMDTLSMGMSGDFITAIQAGATIVRIGRALFGER